MNSVSILRAAYAFTLLLRYRGALHLRGSQVGRGLLGAFRFGHGGAAIISDGVSFRDGVQVDVRMSSLTLGSGVFINRNSTIVCRYGIDIGRNVVVGPNVMIFDHDHVFSDASIPIREQGLRGEKIKIGENVWIGAGVVICKGVRVGSNSIIAAGTVLTKDVPEGCICRTDRKLIFDPMESRRHTEKFEPRPAASDFTD